MWSSWSEKATASLTQALEKTGDALSKAATTAGKQAQQARSPSEKGTSNADLSSAADATASGGEDGQQGQQAKKPPILWGSAVSASLTQALEKTGDVLSKAATNAGKGSRGADAEAEAGEVHPDQMTEKQKEILKNLQMGWSSVVETTKQSIKVAQVKLEEEQTKIKSKIQKVKAELYKRDPKLPLDVEALRDAEVVYLTDRLITMSHPAMASHTHPEIISAERKLAAVQHLLQRRHDGRFMVWNLSEVEYDIDMLDQQVLTFSFPGSPSPPLGLLLKILISMESWLKADERNIAVIHCLTGKGRTSTVLAAFLCWMGEAGFSDIYDALEYIAQCKQLTVEELTIPSQRRYTSYFKNMLDGVRPSQPPLMLKRIILSEAPRYARGPPLSDEQKSKSNKAGLDDDTLRLGCAPYLQVFKGGKLLHTSPASLGYQVQNPDELPFCQIADGAISFHIDQMVQGDILLRCRHLTSRRQRVSMFRAALHTGYIPPKVMRLTKSQLDGACHDDRFPDDFFMDLIFESVDSSAAGQALLDEESETSNAQSSPTNVSGGNTYRASQYDTMLHRDSRFWDVISERKKAHEEGSMTSSDDDKNKDPDWGPTVGRRRKIKSTPNSAAQSVDAAASGTTDDAATAAARKSLETFSIGGELDFLPETIEPEHVAPATKPRPKVAPPKKPKKRDTLMEALMGALDEDDHDEVETEEIVFGEDSDAEVPKTTTPQPTIVALPPKRAPSTTSGAPAPSDASPSEGPASNADTSGSNECEEASASSPPETAAAESEGAAKLDESSPKQESTTTDDMDALLADADLDGVEGSPDGDGDVDVDLDLDDAELADLENFLGAK